MLEVMGALCKFYRITPEQVRGTADFGELYCVFAAAQYRPAPLEEAIEEEA